MSETDGKTKRPQHRRRLRRGLTVGACGLLGLCVIVLAVGWWVLRGEVAAALSDFERQAAGQGYRVDHQGLSFSGFPLQMKAALERPEVSWRGGRWQGPAAVTGDAWITDPFAFRLALPGSNRLDLAGLGMQIDSGLAEASLRMGAPGLDSFALDLRDAALVLDGSSEEARLASLDLSAAPLLPLDDAEAVSDIRLDLLSLLLPPALAQAFAGLGPELQHLSLQAALSGPLAPGPAAGQARAWRDAGGSLRILALSLRWGDFQLEARGRLGLDGALRPLGELQVEMAGLPQLLETLGAAGLLDPGLSRSYGGLLRGLAQPRQGREGRWLTLPLILRDGRARLRIPFAEIPLARLPPLFQG